ncbi:hypothetical protein Hanom_Chr06g00527401 [Helianthus anomalus]
MQIYRNRKTDSAEYWKRLMKNFLVLSTNALSTSATILATLELTCGTNNKTSGRAYLKQF